MPEDNSIWRSVHIVTVYILAISAVYFGTLFQRYYSKRAKTLCDNPRPQKHLNQRSVSDYWAGKLPDDCGEIIDILLYPHIFKQFGSKIPKGILLHGEPGTGKTYFGKLLASITNAHFFYTAASQLDEIYVGSGPRKVRSLFEQARLAATLGKQCSTLEDPSMLVSSHSTHDLSKIGRNNLSIIFLDEIDALGSRSDFRINDGRHATLSQLLSSMDGLISSERILVIGATNYLDAVDGALMRSGRFDRIIYMSLPDSAHRCHIIHFYLKPLPKVHSKDLDLLVSRLADISYQFNCSDLRLLVNQAALIASKRAIKKIKEQEAREVEVENVFTDETQPRGAPVGSAPSISEVIEMGCLVEAFFHTLKKLQSERPHAKFISDNAAKAALKPWNNMD